MISMKKLALLGAARPGYRRRATDIFNNQKDSTTGKYCLTGWSYMIHPSKIKTLQDQFNSDGFFRIYIHDKYIEESMKNFIIDSLFIYIYFVQSDF